MRDEPPEQDGEGFYNTSLPVIIFQMIEQNVCCYFIFTCGLCTPHQLLYFI